jgi:ABC-type molybdenum transport system ATPase subunit/photorepair protein PhrA
MKQLFLLRGLPGSGKSTVAKILAGGSGPTHYEADMYFMQNGSYEFDPTALRRAHEWCKDMVLMDMVKDVPTIAVSNTFTQEWEMGAYYQLAEQYGYQVYSLVVENRHMGVNQHGVPTDKLEQMRNRFEIKL